MFWMSANLPPHTMLTHGFCPVCLSLSVSGSCHHSIEVPLVYRSWDEADLEFPIDLQKKNSLSSNRQQHEAARGQRQATAGPTLAPGRIGCMPAGRGGPGKGQGRSA